MGSTPSPFHEREIEDYGEVVEWIIRQPWSDGQVGATGISYEGIAAELLTVAHPAATKVVVPQEADIDQYAGFLVPGGIPNDWMITTWQHTNEALDQNRLPAEWTSDQSERRSVFFRAAAWVSRLAIKGVRAVDGDKDRAQLSGPWPTRAMPTSRRTAGPSSTETIRSVRWASRWMT